MGGGVWLQVWIADLNRRPQIGRRTDQRLFT